MADAGCYQATSQLVVVDALPYVLQPHACTLLQYLHGPLYINRKATQAPDMFASDLMLQLSHARKTHAPTCMTGAWILTDVTAKG